jgi:hypothetical protein
MSAFREIYPPFDNAAQKSNSHKTFHDDRLTELTPEPVDLQKNTFQRGRLEDKVAFGCL